MTGATARPRTVGLVIVVFNNDSSPYGATNCLPVLHNTARSPETGVSGDIDIRASAIHMHLCTFLSLGPGARVVSRVRFRPHARAHLPSSRTRYARGVTSPTLTLYPRYSRSKWSRVSLWLLDSRPVRVVSAIRRAAAPLLSLLSHT